MSKVMFISDLHWGHKNILNFRPQFDTVEEHDAFLLDSLLTDCNKRDTLYLLGDTTFSEYAVDYVKQLCEHIGYVHYILGNHDSDNLKRVSIVKEVAKVATSIQGVGSKRGLWYQHTPMAEWELRGKQCIHGHVHGNTRNDGRYINVSCENTRYRPVKLEDIVNGWRTWEDCHEPSDKPLVFDKGNLHHTHSFLNESL